MIEEIAKDFWGRYVRVTGFRGGYLVAERIDKYGRKSGGMAMYCPSELRHATLEKRPSNKKTAKRKTAKRKADG